MFHGKSRLVKVAAFFVEKQFLSKVEIIEKNIYGIILFFYLCTDKV